MMKTGSNRRWLAIILWFCGGMGLFAQNNPYHIHDSLFPLYREAFSHYTEKKGLQLADSMRRQSIAIGDKYGELLAMSIPVLYYYDSDYSFERYDREVLQPLERKALEYGILNSYYFATSNRVQYLNDNGRTQEALARAKQDLAFAQLHHHQEGVAFCQKMLGQVHEARGENLLAIGEYRKAIESAKNIVTTISPSYFYKRLATCYRYMGDFESMLKVAQEGLAQCRSEYTRFTMQVNICYAYYLLGRNKEFIALDDSLQRNERFYIGSDDTKHAVEIGRLTLKDSLSQEQLLRKINDLNVEPEDKLLLTARYYALKHDYDKEQSCWQRLLQMRHEESEQNSLNDVDYTSRELGSIKTEAKRQQREKENASLLLDNTRLQLANSSIELGNTRNAARIARLAAEQSDMRLENQRLANHKMGDSLLTQRQRIELDRRLIQRKNTRLFCVSVIVAIIFFSVLLGVLNNRKRSRKLRQSNDQLRQSNYDLDVARERATEAEQMKTQFIQNMSHEIRTPLNAIAGFSEVLTTMGTEIPVEEKKNVHKMIAYNASLLTTLVDDILDMAALESGKYTLEMTTMAVNEICRETIETVRHRKAPGVDLRFQTLLNNDYSVTTDIHRVQQVLINMLTNAEKNTSQGSITLFVSLTESPGMVTFIVEDTGIGVPKDKMEAIFQRFNKLDHQKQGAGLGLDICRTIAEKLGGQIDIDPNYTGGARFWFTIPVKS